MDPTTVTDSTDWLETPLAGLAPLESSLRCQVCKEIFTTPMITSCSHTFCSLCIRRYLSQEGKCPSCRTPDQEMKLRHNWAVQELVEIWSENRAKIFDFAKTAFIGNNEPATDDRPKKRRKLDNHPVVVQKSGLEERRSTRSQSRRAASQSDQRMHSLPSTQEEVPGSDAGSVYSESPDIKRHFQPPEPNDGLVGCPNCTRRMKEALINAHLDKCLQGLAGSPTPPPQQLATKTSSHASSPSRSLQAGTIAYTTTKPITSSTPQRLPTINYSLLNESSLRRKLKELGIPNLGNKEVMRKRHVEWVNLWNANCDSLRPVSKAKLLKELDVWERNLGRDERQRQQQHQGGGSASGGGGGGGGGGAGGFAMMDKDFDREGYMKREKEGFEDLVRRARESRKAKAASKVDKETVDTNPTAESTTTRGTGTTAGDDQQTNQGCSAGHNDDIHMTNGMVHNELITQTKTTSAEILNQLQPQPPPPPPPADAQTLVPNTPPPRPSGPVASVPNQPLDLITPEKLPLSQQAQQWTSQTQAQA